MMVQQKPRSRRAPAAAKKATKKAPPPATAARDGQTPVEQAEPAGFQWPDAYNTIFTLRFDDPQLQGLVVRLRHSYGLVDAGAELLTVDAEAIATGRGTPEDVAKIRQLVRDFAGALQSWNLLDDAGEPVPTDHDTVRSQDFRAVLVLVNAFMGALQELGDQMTAQLRETSEPVDEASLPMESLSH